MHELSIAESVLQLLEDSARRERFSAVRRVSLEIGELAAVEPDALRFCFDLVMRDTIAAGATLEIVQTEGRAWCLACSAPVRIASRIEPCPRCASHQLQVTGGTELRVRELDVT